MSVPQNIENRPIAVIGAGVLGARIALMMADRGGTVHLSDPVSQEALDKAKAYIDENLEKTVESFNADDGFDGGFRPGEVKYFTDNSEAAKGAWLVIEAVPEKIDIKNSTYEDIAEALDDDAILTTNSSSYASSTFVDHVKDPTRFLNTHFGMPPEKNFIEIMGCGQTDDEVYEFLLEEMPKFGLVSVPVLKESTGFAINRIWAAIKREALAVVGEGVSTPEAVDKGLSNLLGTQMGPFALMDAVGLDTVKNIEEHYHEELPWTNPAALEAVAKLVDEGKLGQKTGEGFYDWSSGKPAPKQR
ncbi:hypothetical protein HMPREF3151_09205 [Corynebacterium sp. HMSC05H05]|uniref:3-hydroxyacyl-CoA dehydrogenase family protein n=1 Tax=Corynebacterium sp. HMSC05H05 TaxID=1581119 RepID=UPI0008A2F74C|nr:3-hydroxyacyl-CoA dehydrogenase family protein [Corynebacterium sp. HMSC05H05]OFT56861.1 hypothetical protein HMPREF3151_09205 [Corynebacterium sp. HMSC05H05]